MIKEKKLEKCPENSATTSVKEEPPSSVSCDSTGKELGGNGSESVSKPDDESVSAVTNTNSKEPRGGRSSVGNTTPATNTTNCSNPGPIRSLTSESSDVGGLLENSTEVVPSSTEDTSLTETPALADLQPDAFSDLNIPNTPVGPVPPRQVPMMPHVRPSPNGVQPLASNVIGKSSGSMEVQYMQQQSQIFVFSTLLANKGAEAVVQGQFQSIIAYHCAQPGTKKYLEKHPLKLNQFHRQSPAQWLNGLAMMKNKGCTRGMVNFPPKGPPTLDGFPTPDNMDDIPGISDADVPWEQRNNHHMVSRGMLPEGGPDGNSMEDPCLPGNSPNADPNLMLGHSPIITSTAPTSPSLASLQPSLQGVKVPDADLTPQQRQHREEQLATIRKMQQMLFPEAQLGLGPEEHDDNNPASNLPSCQGIHGGPPNLPPTSMPGHMEWQKMPNQYFDERKMKGHGNDLPPNGPNARGPVPILPQPGVSGNVTSSGPGAQGQIPGPIPGPAPGPRLQGPPPPYHQTPRSASVPIALQSPSPASPNNPTSNLSLPSPRTSSALNSPALGRHFSSTQSPTSQSSPTSRPPNTSNPATPISSHFSPSAPPGEMGSDFPANNSSTNPNHPPSVDGMFCQTLKSMAQKNQHSMMSCSVDNSNSPNNKEANLMPVPSPQRIQYLSTFEGQELTIQKQPNTSLKDRNIISPTLLEGGFSNSDIPGSRVSAPNTPLTPSSVDMGPRFPITSSASSDCYRLPAPSPSSSEKGQKSSGTSGPSPQANRQQSDPMKTPNSDANVRFTAASPMDTHRYPLMGVGGSPGSFPPQQPNQKPGLMAMSPSAVVKPGPPDVSAPGSVCVRGDNVPLNPNSTNGLPGNPKESHFDPISSLAQMSQLLTSTVSSSLNGQGGGSGPGMMSYGGVNAPSMDMGRPDGLGCMSDLDGNMMGMPMAGGPPHVFNPNVAGSPKNMSFMGPQRMINRPNMPPGPVSYNGANVQVKASAPNTIQYLPARPQMGPSNPRGPPSLEFLQRFANPNMEPKMGGQGMQYFPGCGPNSNMGPMDGGSMHNEGMMSGMMNGPMMGKLPMPGPMVSQGMIPLGMGGMRNPGPGLRPGMNPIRMHGMGFDGMGPGMGDGMYPPGGAQQMFKGGPMGRTMCAPDASQPLPPSVGQSNAYKSSAFAGAPTTADPNYAQQFHNFQQQLYATSTRSQLNSQAIGPGPGPPTPQPNSNHMYFMNK